MNSLNVPEGLDLGSYQVLNKCSRMAEIHCAARARVASSALPVGWDGEEALQKGHGRCTPALPLQPMLLLQRVCEQERCRERGAEQQVVWPS